MAEVRLEFCDEQSLLHGMSIDRLEEIIECCLDCEGVGYACEVGVTFTDDENIRKLNRLHRGIDRKTDVLSFPMLEDIRNIEKTDIDPESGAVYLGDIVISVETAIAQAEEYGHSTERELAFLTVHSMMHLMGYDHMEEGERKIMRAHEEGVLDKLNITRGE